MPAISTETLLRYCEVVYDKLAETAEKNGEHDLVWSGKVVAMYSGLGLSNSHYARIFSSMQEVGCIEQLQRGAKGIPTRFALYRRPELADLEGSSQGRTSGLTDPTPHDRLSQRVSILERRFADIDLVKYIAATEERLRSLEAKASRKKQGAQTNAS